MVKVLLFYVIFPLVNTDKKKQKKPIYMCYIYMCYISHL